MISRIDEILRYFFSTLDLAACSGPAPVGLHSSNWAKHSPGAGVQARVRAPDADKKSHQLSPHLYHLHISLLLDLLVQLSVHGQ